MQLKSITEYIDTKEKKEEEKKEKPKGTFTPITELIKEKQQKTGSSFGGSWGVSDLVKEKEEESFQQVYKEVAAKLGLSSDPDDPKHYYDYRALYRDTGKLEPDETGHFPSKYKKEGHPNLIVDGVNTKTGESESKETPPQLQDVAKIMPEAEKKDATESTMGTAEYVGGKIYSTLLEKATFAMAAPVSSGLEKTFRFFGLEDIADKQKEVTEFYKTPPVTEKVEEHTAYLRQQAYEKGTLQGVGFDITESATQLIGLLTQMAATKRLPAFQGKDIGTHFGAMATHAIATTPGDFEDRLQSALFRIGYSMTPFIANATGATGLTAVATDTALNVFLTSSTYKKALEEAENPEQFFSMAIPQLVMDIGMAWNTRGLPANQKQAMLDKYLKAENRAIKPSLKEFNKITEQFEKDFEARKKLEESMPESSFAKMQREEIEKEHTIKPEETTPTTEKSAEVGKPIIAYHGTDKDFDTFDTKQEERFGSHFGSLETVENVAKSTGKDIDKFKIKKVELDIKNPIRLPDITYWEAEKIAEELAKQGITVKPKDYLGSEYYTHEDIIKELQKQGYDGVVYENKAEGGGDSYIAFKPEQIKTISQPTPLTEKSSEAPPKKIETKVEQPIGKVETEPTNIREQAKEILKKRGYDESRINNLLRDMPEEAMQNLVKEGVKEIPSEREKGEKEYREEEYGLTESEQALKDTLKTEIREEIPEIPELPRGEPEKIESEPIKQKVGQPISEMEQINAISLERDLIGELHTKFSNWYDVQSPFVKEGADETGYRVKNYFGEREAGLLKGEELIFKMEDIGKKNNLTQDDFLETTYATESSKYYGQLDKNTRKQIKPVINEVNKFYKDWEKKLKDIGWMTEPFPQSLLARNNRNIDALQEQIERGNLTEKETEKAKQSITDLKAQNKKIKDLDLQFVSVPIRMIMEHGDSAVSKHFLNFLPHWGRKSLTIKDLVEEGVLTKEQADIRNIITEYSDRMSQKYAMGQIFKAAEDDGLIAKASQKPEWSEFTAKIVPQLKGKVVHPAFNDMLTSFFGTADRGMGHRGFYENLVGVTKMMQFYNPIFLPMYDVLQGFAAGTFTSRTTPKSIIQALKDVPLTVGKKHKPASENYIEAFENGLFSVPFSVPFDKYQERINNMMDKGWIEKTLGKTVANPLMSTYQLSWNTAWKGDHIVRMMTYNNLKEQGHSSKEAAQIAAKFHGDYASVPPATRKTLNKFFFTPTFKLAMSKLYTDMGKGAAKTIFTPDKAEAKDKTYAKGLLMAGAALEGMEYFFTQILGYESEQRYRKYTKEVETDDEGTRESVITTSNPFNIPWRYYYRGKSAIDDPSLNTLEKVLDQARYDLTPVLRVAFDVAENKYENVYKFGDDADKQLASTARYVTKELVGITKPIMEATVEPDEYTQRNKEIFQQELGKLNSTLLSPFVFHYTRDTKDKRLQRMLYNLEQNYREVVKTTDDPEQMNRIVDNFYEEQEKILKQLDEYLEKK